MSYKWRPSKTARREFAQKMNNDEEFASAYNVRKQAKKDKFYESLESKETGIQFVPSHEQYNFCLRKTFNLQHSLTTDEQVAINQIMYGYICNEKIDHYHIHIINELRRKNAI